MKEETEMKMNARIVRASKVKFKTDSSSVYDFRKINETKSRVKLTYLKKKGLNFIGWKAVAIHFRLADAGRMFCF